MLIEINNTPQTLLDSAFTLLKLGSSQIDALSFKNFPVKEHLRDIILALDVHPIKTLNLSRTSLDSEDFKLMLEALKLHSHIKELNLSANEINNEESVEALINYLSHTSTLDTINLSNICFSSGQIKNILSTFMDNGNLSKLISDQISIEIHLSAKDTIRHFEFFRDYQEMSELGLSYQD